MISMWCDNCQAFTGRGDATDARCPLCAHGYVVCNTCQTHPCTCEQPFQVEPIREWGKGVLDSIRIIEERIRFLATQAPLSLKGVVGTAITTLEDVRAQLRAMLARGSYSDKSSVLMAEDQNIFAALREMDKQPEKTLRETVEGWKTAVPTKVLMSEETLKGLGYDELSEEERTINVNDAVEGMKHDE